MKRRSLLAMLAAVPAAIGVLWGRAKDPWEEWDSLDMDVIEADRATAQALCDNANSLYANRLYFTDGKRIYFNENEVSQL